MMKTIKEVGPLARGALIVVEGCDRSGKTTQCYKLVTALEAANIKAKYMNFPDRSTVIGQIIHQYLVSKANQRHIPSIVPEVDLSDEVIHLLFSANRWELSRSIRQQLMLGVTLVVDRYAFSGVAYSAAKGLDVQWCKSSDVGLPRPDKVFLLTLSPEAQAKRKGFGEERYEMSEFQKKVMDTYGKLQDSSWTVVDADRSAEDLHQLLLGHLDHKVNGKDILPLWK